MFQQRSMAGRLTCCWIPAGAPMALRSDEIRPSSISCRKRACEMGVTASGTRTPMRHGIAQSVVMGNVHVQNTRIYFGRFDDFRIPWSWFPEEKQRDHRPDKSAALFASSGSRSSCQSGPGFNLNGSGRGAFLRRAGRELCR